MSNRDFGCIAPRRFLAVERYFESRQPSSTDPCGVQRGPDRLARRHAGLEKQPADTSSAAARLGCPSGRRGLRSPPHGTMSFLLAVCAPVS